MFGQRRAETSTPTPSLLTGRLTLNEYLAKSKTGGELAFHRFKANNLPTMEDINAWIASGPARKKQENVEDWVVDTVYEDTKVKKKVKKKSRKLATTSSTIRYSTALSSPVHQKVRPKLLQPQRSNFDMDWPSQSPKNRLKDASSFIDVGDDDIDMDFGRKVVGRSSKVSLEELWHQIGRQVEASCSRFDKFGPSSTPRHNTFETPGMRGTFLARSKADTMKDQKRIQQLLKIKSYREISGDQPARLRTPDYWECTPRQALKTAAKMRATVTLFKMEPQPKFNKEIRDHLQHVFVVNGSAMAFKDCATLGFVHWFAEENVIAERFNSSTDEFYHKFDLSGFMNEEIKMRLYNGKTFVIQATRPCRGHFFPKTVKHTIALPADIRMDSIVISRNDNGHLFVRRSPPPNIKSVSTVGTPH